NNYNRVAACGFPLCVLNIAYPAAGRKSINGIADTFALIRVNAPDIIIHSLPKMNRLQNRL
ncbi:hypothetical protein, partial [Dorea formicigenerans]|uniref:hypothetical protein n=1 Tax=Dorea formicigenerans TaxID=39486 RepID=UPI001A9A5809